MQHIFIINPTAGSKDVSNQINNNIFAAFPSFNAKNIYKTTHAGQATNLAKRLSAEPGEKCIYAVGGDGTLNEVVSGAYGAKDCHVSCVPTGSGNDFIKSFKINPKWFADLARFKNATAKLVNVLEVNGRKCVNIISAGFDAKVGAFAQKMHKKNIVKGKLSYHLGVVFSLFSRINSKYKITINDNEQLEGRFMLMCMGNGRYYGGGYNPCPWADLSDDKMEVVLVKKMSRFNILRIIGKYKKGRVRELPEKIATTHSASKIVIESEKPFYIQYDGECEKTTRAEISVLPEKLSFLLPTQTFVYPDLSEMLPTAKA